MDIERLEKIIAAKQGLESERTELIRLLERLPNAHLKEVQAIKEKISKNHQELMELLKNEENLTREFQKKPS